MEPEPPPPFSDLPAAAERARAGSSGSNAESGLKDSAVAYVAARLELIGIEAREAGRVAARRGLLAGLLAGFAMFAWALLMAAIVGLSAIWLGGGWYWVAFGLGILHLAAAVLVGVVLTRPSAPTFETTRLEIENDRKWLEELGRQMSFKR